MSSVCPLGRLLGDEDQDVADDARDRAGVGVETGDELLRRRSQQIAQAKVGHVGQG